MSFNQPERLRTYLIGHAAIAVVFFTAFYLIFVHWGKEGSDIAARRAVIEREQSELVLVGNSLLKAAVDADEFSKLSGLATTRAHSDGSASLWWYLYVKNVVTRTEHRPRYVGIMFRDAFLTEPAFRVTGAYQKPIRRLMSGEEPLAQELSYSGLGVDHINSPLSWVPRESRNWLNYKIEKRMEDLLDVRRGEGRPALKRVFAEENMVPGLYSEFQLGYETTDDPVSYDFGHLVEQSYLPHLLRLLNERGITPVFIRAKRRRDLDPAGEPEELKAYIAELRQYVTDRGAHWIDFTNEDRILAEHFGPGDHLNRTDGRQEFMRLLAAELGPTLVADRTHTHR
jgi:hypothetical protein